MQLSLSQGDFHLHEIHTTVKKSHRFENRLLNDLVEDYRSVKSLSDRCGVEKWMNYEYWMFSDFLLRYGDYMWKFPIWTDGFVGEGSRGDLFKDCWFIVSGLRPMSKKRTVSVNLSKEICSMIRFMGGTVITKSSQNLVLDQSDKIIYIIAPAPLRTFTYMKGIAFQHPVIHYSWLINSYLLVYFPLIQ
eukprot:TRINITY_DN5201_c0_g1_i2.p1 TRINITY_DN5201_c0_g1~~TRINITY_DN5201_c0_g1_i2.p1  ORF type:complete len:215 (-),score=35.34 TRINITY_DN5201_c0_g1_i2:315-881(-)